MYTTTVGIYSIDTFAVTILNWPKQENSQAYRNIKNKGIILFRIL